MADYAAYLRSEHWRRTRSEALRRAAGTCQLCQRLRAVEVHHRTYERLGCEAPSDLVALCVFCHRRVHCQPETSTDRRRQIAAQRRRRWNRHR